LRVGFHSIFTIDEMVFRWNPRMRPNFKEPKDLVRLVEKDEHNVYADKIDLFKD